MSSSSFLNATGKLRAGMTNDYMFRAVLQSDNNVLVALICSLMHYDKSSIHSAMITNPIILGEHLSEKSVFLDINVVFNDKENINLEMQVINEGNWSERSLYYLCRSFSSLQKGQSYIDTKPTTQIGILDFTLFDDEPAFYSTYLFCNPASGKIFSDKLRLSVLNLKHIDNATDTDKAYNIDIWASLFKATTWEDIKMLATKNPDIEKAAHSIYDLSADEAIMWECEARADYIRRQNDAKYLRERAEKALAEAEAQKAIYKSKLTLSEEKRIRAENQLSTTENQLAAALKRIEELEKAAE